MVHWRDPESVADTGFVKALENQAERLTFLPPDHDMARHTAYYHTATETATTCAAAYRGFTQVLRDRAKKELGNLGASGNAPGRQCPWEVDENRTVSTIFAIKTDPTEQRSPCSSDMDISAVMLRETCPISFNPKVDILWLDCGFQANCEFHARLRSGNLPVDGEPDPDPHPSDTLVMGLQSEGYYSSHLVPVQRLAVEFTERQFAKQCWECIRTNTGRKRYQTWLKAFQDATSPEREMANQACLLCSALETPEFAHLSAEEKQQLKDWMKYDKLAELTQKFREARIRHGLNPHSSRADTTITDNGVRWEFESPSSTANLIVTWSDVDRYWPSEERLEPFDLEAFRQAVPILEKLYRAVSRASLEKEKPLYACLDDFKGDALAFYNNVCANWLRSSIDAKAYSIYHTWKYDEEAGAPICLAGQERCRAHRRWWCKEVTGVASFWPLTTPNLRTLYAIDRGIKLKPGATIPPGTETFQGNGCVYVEVPKPADRSLEAGGVDSVWQYPEGRPWDTNVFDFARSLRTAMWQQYTRFSSWGFNHDMISDRLLQASTAPGVDSPHNRAIEAGNDPPAVKVLAIVEYELDGGVLVGN